MKDEKGMKQDEQNQTKQPVKGMFSLTKGLALSAVISGYILGPLFFFGGIGLLLDHFFFSSHWGLFIGLAIAFLFSNVLVVKKSARIAERFTEKQE